MIYGNKFYGYNIVNEFKLINPEKEYNKFIEGAKKLFDGYDKELDEVISLIKQLSTLEKQINPDNCQTILPKIYEISEYKSKMPEEFDKFRSYCDSNWKSIMGYSSDKNNKLINKKNSDFFNQEYNNMKKKYDDASKIKHNILLDVEKKEKKYGRDSMNYTVFDQEFPFSVIILEACDIIENIFYDINYFYKEYIKQIF